MSEKKWAFDRENLNKQYFYIGLIPKRRMELAKYLQSACEAHAREKVKAFGEEILNLRDLQMPNPHERRECYIREEIKAALKKRGIL